MEAIAHAPACKIGVDPLGGAGRRLLGADRRALRPRPRGRQPRSRPDLRLHDARPRRQDPHGLLVAVRHGGPDRAQGPLRHRLRQRRRRRPPRHRHAQRPGCSNPNHYLAVAIEYLFPHRPGWPARRRRRQDAGLQRDDRPRRRRPRPARCVEVPVGFKWFVDGPARRLARLRRRGERRRLVPAPRRQRRGPPTRTASSWTCWRPRSPRSPARIPASSTASSPRQFGAPVLRAHRRARHAGAEGGAQEALARRTRDGAASWPASRSSRKLTRAPGNDAPIGGLKVVTENGWFAARPSGTEDVYKIYAESFQGQEHLQRIQDEAREIVTAALAA